MDTTKWKNGFTEYSGLKLRKLLSEGRKAQQWKGVSERKRLIKILLGSSSWRMKAQVGEEEKKMTDPKSEYYRMIAEKQKEISFLKQRLDHADFGVGQDKESIEIRILKKEKEMDKCSSLVNSVL